MEQTLILYHYVHCPYCIRVRMAFGFSQISYQSKVTPYHDEKTPLDLCGVKMLPIVKTDNEAMNESLDIISKYCANELPQPGAERLKEVDDLCNKLGKNVHSLAMPYFIWTPEFNEQSRNYFQKKKEQKRGPFKDLMKKKKVFIESLTPDLENLEKELKPFYQSSEFGVEDIMIASHLWAMFIVPEFQFPPKLYSYLMSVKEKTGFEYHQDYME